jgi:IPT/TIG domain
MGDRGSGSGAWPAHGGRLGAGLTSLGKRVALGALLLAAMVFALAMPTPEPASAAAMANAPTTAPSSARSATPTTPSGLNGAFGAITTPLMPNELAAGTPFSGHRIRHRAPHPGISTTPSTTEPHWACLKTLCEAIVNPPAVRVSGHWRLPDGGRVLGGSGEKGGFDPVDLQSAYNVHPRGGAARQTIALVEGAGDPEAEEDLAKYRERYGLKPCTTANGCFRKVNEEGQEKNYPPSNEWEFETSIDVDMVSATCPECHILLVEANSEAFADLGASVNKAVELGATEISNSYGFPEEFCGEGNCEQFNVDYDHPGVPVIASAGDTAYDNQLDGWASPEFPAASPYVVAVGGTSLEQASNKRGWSEEVWLEPGRGLGGGGGCSRSEQKPAWQFDTGCATRADNDVAAVSACGTPVSVYDTVPYGGWETACGTSVAAPLVAGIEAHASEYVRSLPGAEAFYTEPSAMFDVTAGGDGVCEPEYLCNAGVGYDGPTGNGAPDGPFGFTSLHPIVATRPASAVRNAAAVLNGGVDPEGVETTYRFEYWTQASEKSSVPVPDASAGAGTAKEEFSREITGLHPNTTYHYRLVAANSKASSQGEERAFNTAPPTVTGVEPHTGSATGGTPVTISGTNFAGATAVKFGTTNAKSFSVSSETSLTAVSPPGSGTLDVTVTTPAGTTPTSPADHFGYQPSQWTSQNVPLPEGPNASFGGAIVNCSIRPLACGAVSCASHASCVAVGTDNYIAIAESWNGAQWSAQELPASEGASDVAMTGISCTTATACMAVGYEKNATKLNIPVVDQWNGTQWSISALPLPSEAKEAAFEGVSCSSSSECTAVGLDVTGAGTKLPFIARSKAGVWNQQSTPNLPEAATAILEGVSCPSSTSCTAVGFNTSSGGVQTALIESWNGENWSLGSAAIPTGGASLGFNGVSCTAASACTAVGGYTASTGVAGLAERWDGAKWSVESTANIGPQEELAGVSCATSEECTAVGEDETKAGLWVAMTQKWNGVAWTGEASPVGETQASELRAVSCVLESTCVSVGTFRWSAGARSHTGQVRALIELRGETNLAEQATPTISGATQAKLSGASCATSVACVEVGSYKTTSGTTVSLADAWNGIAWLAQSTPNPAGATVTELHHVSCPSATVCTAVGSDKNSSGTTVTLAEQWSAGEWTIQATPNPTEAIEAKLSAVSCASSTFCTAVGEYKTSSGGFLSLAETWNGKEWMIQSTPNPSGATSTALANVSCASESLCTGVGSYVNSASQTVSLAEIWNGSGWQIQSTPNPAGSGVELSGISCAASTACTAVGSYTTSGGNAASLAEGWNGTEWTIQSIEAPPGAVQTRLVGVSCSVGRVCVAVGWYRLSTGNPVPLAELWNGRESHPWPAPSPSAEGGELLDVSCTSMYACEAAGTYTTSSKVQSLAEGLGAPYASTGQPQSVSYNTATFTGTVAPNQWATSYRFEYGETTSYGSSLPVPEAHLLSETSGEEVHLNVTGLHEGSTYHFRLVATNPGGTSYGSDETFTDLATPAITRRR